MSASESEVVRITVGIVFRLASCLMRARTSRPSILGMFKSSKTRLGRGASAKRPSFLRNAIASTPSAATFKCTELLALRNASCVRRTSPGLSSTKRTSVCMAFPPKGLETAAACQRECSRRDSDYDALASAVKDRERRRDNLANRREPRSPSVRVSPRSKLLYLVRTAVTGPDLARFLILLGWTSGPTSSACRGRARFADPGPDQAKGSTQDRAHWLGLLYL